MRRTAFRVLLIPACLLSGCGGTASQQSTLTVPRHGGTMIALADGRGFVEIVNEREAATRGDRRAQTKARILAYFYQPDGTTAMSTPPSEVKVKIGNTQDGPVVSLSPEPKEAGKFASEPGTYPDGFRGQIDAKVNGEPVQTSFLIR